MDVIIRPVILSMKASGLLPIKANSRASIGYVFAACGLLWLQVARSFFLIFLDPPAYSEDEKRRPYRYTLCYLMVTVDLLSGAVVRTSVIRMFMRRKTHKFISHLLRVIEREATVNNLMRFMRNIRKTSLAVCLTLWTLIALNFITQVVFATLYRDEMLFMLSPFHLISKTRLPKCDWRIVTALSHQLVSQILSDSTLFVSCFIGCQALVLAKSFKQVNTALVKVTKGNRRSPSCCNHHIIRKKSTLSGGVATVPVTLSQIRMKHYRLMQAVRKLDDFSRIPLFFRSMNSFFTILVAMFVLIWEPPNTPVMKAMWMLWLCGATMFILFHFTFCAILNYYGHLPLNTLYGLKPGSANNEQNQETSVMTQNINLFISQLSSQRIGLTLFGVVSLRKQTIFTLFGMLLTYYILLLDFANIHRRRMAMDHSVATNGSMLDNSSMDIGLMPGRAGNRLFDSAFSS